MLQELKTYKYKQYTIKSLSKSIQIINVLRVTVRKLHAIWKSVSLQKQRILILIGHQIVIKLLLCQIAEKNKKIK